MKPNYLNNSGLSIVATVMIMMILALFAAAAVSLVTTSTGTGIQEERGVEAFYIADGGLQYTLKRNTYPYYDGDYDPPIADDLVTNISLGNGTFTVTVPTLTSIAGIGAGATSFSASSSEGFTTSNKPSDATPNQFWVLMCDTTSAKPPVRMTSDCEKISCETAFATCTRGRDSTVAVAHLQDAVVMMYSWNTNITATLARDLAKGAKCKNAASRICVSDTTPFADSGFIRIHYPLAADENNIEDIFYDGKDNDGSDCGSTCSGGCLGTISCTRRAFDYDNGTGNGTVNHSGNTIFQSEFSVLVTSTGITPGAILAPLTNIRRVLQTNVMSLKDP